MNKIFCYRLPGAAGNPEDYPYSSSVMRISTVRILLSALILGLGSLAIPADGAEILWSQYCQHRGKTTW